LLILSRSLIRIWIIANAEIAVIDSVTTIASIMRLNFFITCSPCPSDPAAELSGQSVGRRVRSFRCHT
jgi:hypothetical protein